jgi:hypothetical protein
MYNLNEIKDKDEWIGSGSVTSSSFGTFKQMIKVILISIKLKY